MVGGKLNTALANPTTGNLSFANNLVKGAVTNIASNVATQLTQIALDGKGKLSWTSVAVAGIYGIGSGLEANRRQEALIAEQRAAQGLVNQPPYSTATQKGDFTRELLNSQQVAAAEDKKYGFNGLKNTYFDNGLTSQDDLAAIQAGGLRVRTLGEVKDVPPAQGIKVKADTEALNNENTFAQDVSNRAFNVDRIRRAEISNQMAMIFAADKVLQNKEILAKAPIIKYDNTVLRDGDKNPSISVMEYNSLQAYKNSFDYQQSRNLQSGLAIVATAYTGYTAGRFIAKDPALAFDIANTLYNIAYPDYKNPTQPDLKDLGGYYQQAEDEKNKLPLPRKPFMLKVK